MATKSSKKVATKAAKVAGVAKVPRYAQREAALVPLVPKASQKNNK